MSIFLVRHGQKQQPVATDLGLRSPVCLTKKGVVQVDLLSQFLLERYPNLEKLDYLYSSPLPRAVQSAEILRSRLDIGEIRLLPILEEFSVTDGYSKPKLEQDELLCRSMVDIDFVPPNGISLRSRLDEVLGFFQDRVIKGDSNLLISSHGVLIRNLVYYLFPEYKPQPVNILKTKIHSGGLTVFGYDGERYDLRCFDMAEHLESTQNRL